MERVGCRRSFTLYFDSTKDYAVMRKKGTIVQYEAEFTYMAIVGGTLDF